MNIFETLLIQPLTSGLILFYRILGGNLGLAILVFSIVLIFVLRPLTKPYLASMKKIKDLEPQLSKLKKKYANDKLKMSQVQAELYKENKINPAAGCLPYLLQFVVLIALFNVFTTALSGSGDVTVNINKRIYEPLRFKENESLNTKFLYMDMSKPDSFAVPGIPFALPGIFLLLATVAQFVSVKITTPYISAEQKVAEKTKSDTDDMQVAMQKSMTYTLPLMTLFFGLKFPSGLALYWLVFSLVNVWQQVGMSGWGSLTPLIKRIGLLKSTA
ncbi:MAG: Preprotein translocase YidC subunit [Candidatus Woesebacteria bacterium GW2011_GWB1_45_5]|uniref:Preprotein translocase YidC subunit n=1 Tax=Candidatus Woesebacteria bacterium GW2011_GWB1_45_5 TaxID=1618581 RepID=A0A0G1MNL4_9BACT|nr:MAG: Preprotein translocase YidC subunit [Candidatus Woesebacteria bacterium GW2011_GWB1_45_5]